MKKVFYYLSKTKKEAILAPLFKMLEVIFELLIPVIVSNIIDNGIKQRSDADIPFIILMCVVMLVLAILGLISAVVAQYFSAKAAVSVSTLLRNDLFKKIQSLKYQDLDEIGTSTLITRMNSDVNAVQTGVNMTLRLLLRSPVVVVGAVFVSFTISIDLGYIFLLTVPSLFIIIFLIILICIPLFKKSQEKLDKTVLLARENLNGVRVIRAFNNQEEEIIEYKKRNKDLTKSQLFVGRLSNLTNPLTFAIINLFIVLLLYKGSFKVNDGLLSQGQLIALYNLISQILVESIKFANLIITISKALASSKRLEGILNMESRLDNSDNKEILDNYVLNFKNVSMRYNKNSDYALKDISFSVNKGDVIGIIGGTGSGKTTIVNLMNHFYDVEQGEITLLGRDIKSYNQEEINKIISIVPQKAKLFKGTIRSNLLWGNKNASDEDLMRSIKLSQSEDIIIKKKNGLDEIVEQDGRNFSGGQKQRLCIARALVKNAPILILDDSSSALDYATDALLRKNIASLGNDLTTIIVSQRTSSIAHADKIIVLDRGQVVGIGKHEDLLMSCLIYQEIHQSQYKKEVKHEK